MRDKSNTSNTGRSGRTGKERTWTTCPTSAFTLIELLVVISIIGILVTIGFVSFTSAQKQARDAQRRSDLKQFQTALEQYGNKNNGLYPSRNVSGGESASVILCQDLGITTCPSDPRSAQDPSFSYQYQSDGTVPGTPTATRYVLWGKIENASTTTYLVICSSGNVGEMETGIPPTSGACPI
ncbi:type II secretion system protein [Candidatus Woesebacteria bacterium]|nr:type II secretion system protein [Candidatus Woesebacteria bacterium]